MNKGKMEEEDYRKRSLKEVQREDYDASVSSYNIAKHNKRSYRIKHFIPEKTTEARCKIHVNVKKAK